MQNNRFEIHSIKHILEQTDGVRGSDRKRSDRLEEKRLKTAAEFAHIQIREGRLTDRATEMERREWIGGISSNDFTFLQSGTLRDCPEKKKTTLQQFPLFSKVYSLSLHFADR